MRRDALSVLVVVIALLAVGLVGLALVVQSSADDAGSADAPFEGDAAGDAPAHAGVDRAPSTTPVPDGEQRRGSAVASVPRSLLAPRP